LRGTFKKSRLFGEGIQVHLVNLLTNILKAYKMGHIKEPDGVDFIINGKPLTDKERKTISEFIKAYKVKKAKQQLRKKKTANTKKRETA